MIHLTTRAPPHLKEDSDAEENCCAIDLDRLAAVMPWVCNLACQPEASFWLPTSTDRFHPDVVAELTAGCLLRWST